MSARMSLLRWERVRINPIGDGETWARSSFIFHSEPECLKDVVSAAVNCRRCAHGISNLRTTLRIPFSQPFGFAQLRDPQILEVVA